MNCQQAQHQLQTTVDFVSTAPDGVLLDHLQHCPACQTLAEQQRLQALLHSLPIPPSSPEFAERALAQAWQQDPDHRHQQRGRSGARMPRWPMAAAASVLAVVGGLSLLLHQEPAPDTERHIVSDATQPPADVAIDAAALQQVEVLLVSGKTYSGANITLRLDENMSLRGHPGQRSLQWQSDIVAGNNQLTLPVDLKGSDSGVIRLEIESGGVVKTATFTVTNQHSVATNLVATTKVAVHLRQPISNEV